MSDHALVIGIDRYPGMPGGDLGGAVRDAIEIATWLLDHGGVPSANLHLVLGPGASSPAVPSRLAPCNKPGTASSGEVQAAMARFRSEVPPEAQRIWFYFAGHGVMTFSGLNQSDGICLSDFQPFASNLSLTIESVLQYVRTIESREQIILIDACRDQAIGVHQRLGEYSSPELGRPPYPWQFVLKATALGQQAAEDHLIAGREGGAFTGALLEALKGKGAAAKRRRADGGYDLTWSALGQHVCETIAARRIAMPDGAVQMPMLDGEHPGGSDPIIARFSAGSLPPAQLEVRLTPAEATAVVKAWPSDDDEEAALSTEAAGGRALLTLDPGVYTIRARAPRWKLKQKPAPLPLWGESGSLALALEPLPDIPGAAPVDRLSPAASPATPPPSSAPTVPSGFEFRPGLAEKLSTVFSETFPRAGRITDAVTAPTRRWRGRSLPTSPPPAPSPTASITLRCPDPLAMLVLETIKGERIQAGAGSVRSENLAAGSYRLRAIGPDGQEASQLVTLDAEDDETATLCPPTEITSELMQLLQASRAHQEAAQVFMPSESAGPITSLRVSTLVTLALGQALESYSGRLTDLRLGKPWRDAEPTDVGVHVLYIDPSGTPMPTLLISAQSTRESKWSRELSRPRPDLPLLGEAAVPMEPGHYWLELVGPEALEKGALNLSCPVLPGRVTLVVVDRSHRESAGPWLYSVERRAQPYGFFPKLRHAERVQRALAAGRLEANDPAMLALISGEVDEPVTAALAGFALHRLIEAGAVEHRGALQSLSERLTVGAPSLVDGWLLLTLAGGIAATADDFRPAFEIGAAPVTADGFKAMLSAMCSRDVQTSLDERLSKLSARIVPHRLWTTWLGGSNA